MSDDIRFLDKDKLAEIFKYLNQTLRENQLQLEITVCGDSVMTRVYDNRPATKDIDCVLSETNFKLFEEFIKVNKICIYLI